MEGIFLSQRGEDQKDIDVFVEKAMAANGRLKKGKGGENRDGNNKCI